MWIPGVISPETVKWCAEHRYPYIGLGTMLGPTCDLWDYYADEAAKHGYQAGPENFGYLIPTVLAETQEKADKIAENFVFGGGQNAFSAPEFTMPPGYNSKSAIRALAKQPTGSWLGVSGEKLAQQAKGGDEAPVDYAEVHRKLVAGLDKVKRNYQVIAGTPATVTPKIKSILKILRPGVFIMFSVQGPVSNEERMTSMRLFAQEVMPALHEYAKEIDLPDPFQRKPGSLELRPGVKREPVADRGHLAELGLR
jgi:alkanesulfonate monooxygenase SsuD/methylene tetrahydromethanopterin reductase-like flavin-dependent oxidoreductase (luciferase family)